VEVLAVRAQVLGQVIDASGQERDWTSDEPVSLSWVLYSLMISGLTTEVDMVM
jgi:hypothetical protein